MHVAELGSSGASEPFTSMLNAQRWPTGDLPRPPASPPRVGRRRLDVALRAMPPSLSLSAARRYTAIPACPIRCLTLSMFGTCCSAHGSAVGVSRLASCSRGTSDTRSQLGVGRCRRVTSRKKNDATESVREYRLGSLKATAAGPALRATHACSGCIQPRGRVHRLGAAGSATARFPTGV